MNPNKTIDVAIAKLTTEGILKPGNTIQVTGQIDSMKTSFADLGIGLLFAAVFVYFLMVVNYQNFADPLVVLLALPATFCGIVTMLYVTDTTLSVPSLMGAIMAVGVASANSILLLSRGLPAAPMPYQFLRVSSMEEKVSIESCNRLRSAAPRRASRLSVQYRQASAKCRDPAQAASRYSARRRQSRDR